MVLSWEREIQLFLGGREGGRADSWYGAAVPQYAMEIQTCWVRELGEVLGSGLASLEGKVIRCPTEARGRLRKR